MSFPWETEALMFLVLLDYIFLNWVWPFSLKAHSRHEGFRDLSHERFWSKIPFQITTPPNKQINVYMYVHLYKCNKLTFELQLIIFKNALTFRIKKGCLFTDRNTSPTCSCPNGGDVASFSSVDVESSYKDTK